MQHLSVILYTDCIAIVNTSSENNLEINFYEYLIHQICVAVVAQTDYNPGDHSTGLATVCHQFALWHHPGH